MANEYQREVHCFVTIKAPQGAKALFDKDEGLDYDEPLFGPHEITLITNERVWFKGDYHFLGLYEELRAVTDGSSKSLGEDGECILSVPRSWCKFYTDEEAESIARCMDADQDLLSYARG